LYDQEAKESELLGTTNDGPSSSQSFNGTPGN